MLITMDSKVRDLIDRQSFGSTIRLNDQNIQDKGVEYLATKATHKVHRLELTVEQQRRQQYYSGRHQSSEDKSLGYAADLQLSGGFCPGVVLEDKGCRMLSQLVLPQIRSVAVNRNKIGGAGVSHLCKADWPTLHCLLIGENDIGCQGVRHIVRAKWKDLRVAYLQDSRLGVIELVEIALSPWQIKEAQLCFNRLTTTQQVYVGNFIQKKWIIAPGCLAI